MPRWGGHQLRQERAGMESRAGNWDVSEGKWGGWAGVNPARWELGRGDLCSELAPELSGGEQSLKSELKHYLRHERDSSWMDGWKGEGRESPSSLHTSEIEGVNWFLCWWSECGNEIIVVQQSFFFFFFCCYWKPNVAVLRIALYFWACDEGKRFLLCSWRCLWPLQPSKLPRG